MANLTKEQIEGWLIREEDEFTIEGFRRKYNIDPESSELYVTFHRMVENGQLKRLKRGWYRKVKEIEAIKWWNGEEAEPMPIIFPYGVDDETTFGFDETIEIYPGDSLVLAGDSNYGKTTWALNFMVNNLHLFEGCTMMVNEYKPQRFKARMNRFVWADYWNEDRPKFELLPVTKNHVDYIKPNYLNIIDWLHVKGEFWEVAEMIEEYQMKLRSGIVLVVLQKTTGRTMGVGGDWGKFFPAFYASIDPNKLTVRKCKSWRGRNPENRMWGFEIFDGGSKFGEIREVKNCPSCKGSGYLFGKKCDKCYGKSYLDWEG